MNNLAEIIRQGCVLFNQARKDKKYYQNDKYILAISDNVYKSMYSQIHSYLVPMHNDSGEKEIRQHIDFICNYIIPTLRDKIKRTSEKIKNVQRQKSSEGKDEIQQALYETYKAYCSIYEDFFALSCFRNLENFAMYMEWGMPEQDKIWKYNLNCFKGFWYYANKMVLDGTVKYIEKQCPTGYGKSYSDIVLIAYIFGYDYNADILKVVGNPSIVADITEKLAKYMCKPNYAKVFPYYAQFECDQNKMFDICRKGGNNQSAKLLIHGSIKGTSFLMVNKDTAVDGGRFKYRFYDDITRSKDKGNVKMHEKDIAKYNDQWKKRNYDDNNNFEIFGGTTYHIYDFLSTIKRLYGGEEATQSKVNRYTKFNKKWKSVFISVPKLDYETDESTYPHKYTTESARNDRKHNYETFMAMDMQMPMPIEGCPFSYDNIQCYDTIPHKNKEEECCYAMLDPARTGANYVAMTICLPIDGKHYLKDCIFVMQPMDKVYSRIINKIEQHHITHLLIEKNTDTSLKTLLDDMLHKRGIFFCKIEEIYSYKKKEDKIYDNEQTIKSYIVFPRFEDYAQGSEMGKYMKYIISFSYTEPNLYDDSPDSLAMYCQHFISSRKIKNEIKFIKRKK